MKATLTEDKEKETRKKYTSLWGQTPQHVASWEPVDDQGGTEEGRSTLSTTEEGDTDARCPLETRKVNTLSDPRTECLREGERHERAERDHLTSHPSLFPPLHA